MTTIKDVIKKPKGCVEFIAKDDAGKETLLRESNLCLDNLYEHIIDCLREGTSITNYIDKISLGTGGHSAGDDTIPIPPSHDDTSLETEIDPPGKKSLTGITSATAYEVEFNTVFLKTECNTRITEAGLWLDDGTTLVNRTTFPAFEKTNSLLLVVRWHIYFTIV
mgnify:CR=1 FL=1